MRTLVFKLIGLSTIIALLSSCGLGGAGTSKEATNPNIQRINEGRISVEVPKEWTQTPDFKPTLNGFTTSWANSQEDPTDIVRMSTDQGQGPNAEATMEYFEANAMFKSTHGPDFKLGNSKDLDIKNATQAKLTTWTTIDKSGRTVQGAWVFVSSEEDPAVAGVEIMALTLTKDEINNMVDSIQFDPTK